VCDRLTDTSDPGYFGNSVASPKRLDITVSEDSSDLGAPNCLSEFFWCHFSCNLFCFDTIHNHNPIFVYLFIAS